VLLNFEDSLLYQYDLHIYMNDIVYIHRLRFVVASFVAVCGLAIFYSCMP